MDQKAFALKMIQDVAARQKLPPETIARLSADQIGGNRPRIGAVLDMLVRTASELPRHLAESDFIALGPYLFFAAESYLQDDDREIRLTEKERDILLALLDAKGGIVRRNVLLDRVWGYASGVETHTLETHIYRLRQKIETDPAHPVLLLTEEEGYSLSAECFADAQ